MSTEKLTLKDQLGYSSASIGDSIAYTFVGVYLMFFLTTVAGIAPGVAGTITAVGSVWNALFNPLMGFYADRVRTKFGRRRPIILFFAIPLAITITLLFTKMPIPSEAKSVYYGLMLMLFWTSYTGFFVPYLALGVDYTDDYDQRTVLRLWASVANMIGNVVTMLFPTLMVDFLVNKGLTTGSAWTCVGLFMGAVASASIIVTVIMSKHVDLPCAADADEDGAAASEDEGDDEASEDAAAAPAHHKREKTAFSLTIIVSEYVSVARLKPVKWLIIASTTALIAYQLILSNLVYYLTFNHGYSAGNITLCLLGRALFGMVIIPITAKAVTLLDKRGTLIAFFCFGSLGMLAMRITGTEHIATILFYLLLAAICTSTYWNLMPSIYFDICEYDKLETGKDRQATIVSFQGLVEAVALGLGTLILGTILQFAGFDGEKAVQSAQALTWIENCATVVPIIFLVLASIAVFKYPITRKRHAEITRQLQELSNNKE